MCESSICFYWKRKEGCCLYACDRDLVGGGWGEYLLARLLSWLWPLLWDPFPRKLRSWPQALSPRPPTLLNCWAFFYSRFLWKLLCGWCIWEVIPGSRSGASEGQRGNVLTGWPVLGATRAFLRSLMEFESELPTLNNNRGKHFSIGFCPSLMEGGPTGQARSHYRLHVHCARYPALPCPQSPGQEAKAHVRSEARHCQVTPVWSWSKPGCELIAALVMGVRGWMRGCEMVPKRCKCASQRLQYVLYPFISVILDEEGILLCALVEN